MSSCSLSDPACAQCGQPTVASVLPTDQGPMTVALLCGPCHDKAWSEFVWIKTWSLRFERWGAPSWVIAAWWAYWTAQIPEPRTGAAHDP